MTRVAATLLSALLLAGCTAEGNGAPPLPTPTAPSEGPTDVAGLTATDRAQAVAAAEAAAEAILSYDYRTLDRDAATVSALMTPSFQGEFERDFTGARATIERVQGSSRAEVSAAGLVAADTTEATVLLFVDQTVRRKGADKSVMRLAPVITLRPRGGRWLVAGLETGDFTLPADEDGRRRAVIEAASVAAASFFDLSWRSVDADVARTRAMATGLFLQQYDANSTQLVSATRENRTIQRGETLAAAVAAIDDRAAAVLVQAQATTETEGSGRPPAERRHRLLLKLAEVDGRWLVSEFSFVP